MERYIGIPNVILKGKVIASAIGRKIRFAFELQFSSPRVQQCMTHSKRGRQNKAVTNVICN
jgi:hypothetical protein